MTTFDGRKQRNALTAAERALRAVAAGDLERAAKSAAKAFALDQIGTYATLPAAVAAAAADRESDGSVGAARWQQLTEAVGPGPLAFLAAELAGRDLEG